MIKQVTKSELAKATGKTPQHINKLAKQGIFDGCMAPNGKMYLDKALNVVDREEYYTPSDEEVHTTENLGELDLLLEDVQSPGQKVQITKDFWAGKIQKQRYLAEKKELIPVNEAKAVIEMLFHPISRNLDNLHIDLKARYPDVSVEAIAWVENTINDMKQSLQDHQWEGKK